MQPVTASVMNNRSILVVNFMLHWLVRTLPDLWAGYVQLKMHEMPAACLVQFAVNRDCGQEGILGIKRPVNDQTQ